MNEIKQIKSNEPQNDHHINNEQNNLTELHKKYELELFLLREERVHLKETILEWERIYMEHIKEMKNLLFDATKIE